MLYYTEQTWKVDSTIASLNVLMKKKTLAEIILWSSSL
jgi:hypothetical protein